MAGHPVSANAAPVRRVGALDEDVAAPSRRLLHVAAATGLVLALGWVVDRTAAAAAVLVATQVAVGVAVGAAVVLVLAYVTRAGWLASVRRAPEALMMSLPVLAPVVLVSLALAVPLYVWTDAHLVAHDELLAHKSGWLNVPAFLLRAVLILALWMWLAKRLRRTSLAQDASRAAPDDGPALRWSAIFLAVLAVTWSVATFDWLMSLQPHWFSTMYAWASLAGSIVSALAATTLMVLFLERSGPFRGILTERHRHDLGKLLFGFSTFWAYLWFCQYMLIWYSHIPEETSYYVVRTSSTWMPQVFACLALGWGIPFFGLMTRRAKISRHRLVLMSIALLLGRWLDVHLMVAPAVGSPASILWQVPALIGVFALLVWASRVAFARAPRVPVGDPYLFESLPPKEVAE